MYQVTKHVCMSQTTKRVCMSETLNYSPEEWVRFLTENVQFFTFNSFFCDLWGGTFGGPRHTYIHTYMLTESQLRMLSKIKGASVYLFENTLEAAPEPVCFKTLCLSWKMKPPCSNIHSQVGTKMTL